jgi:hypothetical protein
MDYRFSGTTCSSAFSPDDFAQECSATYFDSSDSCRDVTIEIGESSSDTWKWIIVGVVLGVAAAIGLYILYKWCSAKRVSPELTDADIARPFEHEVAWQKKQAAQAKLEAKAKARADAKAEARGSRPGTARRAAEPEGDTTARPPSTAGERGLASQSGSRGLYSAYGGVELADRRADADNV